MISYRSLLYNTTVLYDNIHIYLYFFIVFCVGRLKGSTVTIICEDGSYRTVVG